MTPIIFAKGRPSVATPNIGSDMPVYNAANADHVLHVFEDWSTYAAPSNIASTLRVDGGASWINDGPTFQSFDTVDVDPWGTGKALVMDNQTATSAAGRGLVLSYSSTSPPQYLNAPGKASVVIEWAWKFTGTHPYVGKICDYQPFVGTDRFNYQSEADMLGQQVNSPTHCDLDTLCSLYYSGNGTVARLPHLPLPSDYADLGFARTQNGGNVWFYKQNRNFKAGSKGTDGFVDTGANGVWADNGSNLMNQWNRTKLRLTLNLSSTMGQGRIEEWFQTGTSAPIKLMEFYGDPGQYDAGLVRGRDPAQGLEAWVCSPGNGSTALHFYDLVGAGQYNGGSIVSAGYFRMWSHSRLAL